MLYRHAGGGKSAIFRATIHPLGRTRVVLELTTLHNAINSIQGAGRTLVSLKYLDPLPGSQVCGDK